VLAENTTRLIFLKRDFTGFRGSSESARNVAIQGGALPDSVQINLEIGFEHVYANILAR
jgi:hypothetical protein